jgi:signal recognition particle subunit SRP19
MQRANPDLVPAPVAPKPKAETETAVAKPKASKKDKGKKGKGKATTVVPVRLPTRPPPAPRPFPALEDRLPVHSPMVEAGVAVSALQRDLEAEKEQKKQGLLAPEEGGKEKMPKMKRVVVRGGRR